MTYTIEALHKNNRFFYSRLKVLENTRAALAKVTFSELQALKTIINGYDDDLDILHKNFQSFLTVTNKIYH